MVFPESAPQTRKELYEVIVSQLPEVKAELVARFCAAVKNIDAAKLYDKMVTQADKKYGPFNLYDIDVQKELEDELMDCPVYMMIGMIQDHFSRQYASKED